MEDFRYFFVAYVATQLKTTPMGREQSVTGNCWFSCKLFPTMDEIKENIQISAKDAKLAYITVTNLIELNKSDWERLASKKE